MKRRLEARLATTANMIPIGDVIFDNVDMESAVQWILDMAKQHDKPRYVCTANVDHLALCEKDAEFREIYKRADLVLADGMPIVWLSHPHIMGPLLGRVAGSDLFWNLASVSGENNLRLFFMGGAPGSAELARKEVLKRFPTAQICGTYCPSFELFHTEEEQERIRTAILEAKPDVLLVGLGAPKQEKWIVAHRDEIRVPVSIGVGGSFEMAGGLVRRAPVWMQRVGMEWLYRLCQEPKRLWNRYMRRDMPYLMGHVPNTVRMILFRLGLFKQKNFDSSAPNKKK